MNRPRKHGITARERDRILDAIRADPGHPETVAARFSLAVSTIEKMAVFA